MEEQQTGSKQPRCLALARPGITNDRQFANVMSALMTDLIEGTISPGAGNSVCNAGGKLLKVAELRLKYGQVGKGSGEKTLQLAGPEVLQHNPSTNNPKKN